LGCNVGGFTDCLLQHGARRVYAVDTAYGVLAWTLRKDPRVVVMERTNALHVRLPEPVDIVTIDVGWTRQAKILPVARGLLKPQAAGGILTLIKPHYESEEARVQGGVLRAEQSVAILERVAADIERMGFVIRGIVQSPIEGQKGNREFVAWLTGGSGFQPDVVPPLNGRGVASDGTAPGPFG
jgi:23S rRNA (cytidine1920-2'-O)/16S rRNA (cytidine1409-2'-O)-methyltransferase